MAVVGKVEQESGQVDLRDRDQKNPIGKMSVQGLVDYLQKLAQPPSSFQKKMTDKAFYGKQEVLDELEKELKESMFLGGFEPS